MRVIDEFLLASTAGPGCKKIATRTRWPRGDSGGIEARERLTNRNKQTLGLPTLCLLSFWAPKFISFSCGSLDLAGSSCVTCVMFDPLSFGNRVNYSQTTWPRIRNVEGKNNQTTPQQRLSSKQICIRNSALSSNQRFSLSPQNVRMAQSALESSWPDPPIIAQPTHSKVTGRNWHIFRSGDPLSTSTGWAPFFNPSLKLPSASRKSARSTILNNVKKKKKERKRKMLRSGAIYSSLGIVEWSPGSQSVEEDAVGGLPAGYCPINNEKHRFPTSNLRDRTLHTSRKWIGASSVDRYHTQYLAHYPGVTTSTMHRQSVIPSRARPKVGRYLLDSYKLRAHSPAWSSFFEHLNIHPSHAPTTIIILGHPTLKCLYSWHLAARMLVPISSYFTLNLNRSIPSTGSGYSRGLFNHHHVARSSHWSRGPPTSCQPSPSQLVAIQQPFCNCRILRPFPYWRMGLPIWSACPSFHFFSSWRWSAGVLWCRYTFRARYMYNDGLGPRHTRCTELWSEPSEFRENPTQASLFIQWYSIYV